MYLRAGICILNLIDFIIMVFRFRKRYSGVPTSLNLINPIHYIKDTRAPSRVGSYRVILLQKVYNNYLLYTASVPWSLDQPQFLEYFLSSLFLFGPGGFLFSLTFLVQVACMRHQWWRTEAKLAIIFTRFFSFFLLSFYIFCFSPTSGKLPWLKSPSPYFGITRRNI